MDYYAIIGMGFVMILIMGLLIYGIKTGIDDLKEI